MENINENYANRPWLLRDDEELISVIQKRPAIWNASIEHNKDRRLKHLLWEEVAELVERNMNDVKKRWDSLTTFYNSELKGRNAYKKGGANPLPFKLHEQLGFLSGVPLAKKSCSSRDIHFEFVNVDDDISNKYFEINENEEDPLDINKNTRKYNSK